MWNGFSTKQAIKLAALFVMEGRTFIRMITQTIVQPDYLKALSNKSIETKPNMYKRFSVHCWCVIKTPYATAIIVPTFWVLNVYEMFAHCWRASPGKNLGLTGHVFNFRVSPCTNKSCTELFGWFPFSKGYRGLSKYPNTSHSKKLTQVKYKTDE